MRSLMSHVPVVAPWRKHSQWLDGKAILTGYRFYMRTLVVAPHQDDEVIGCGGLILRLIQEQASLVSVLWVSERTGSTEIIEAHQAVETLGVSNTISLKQPPVGLVYNQATLNIFVRAFRRVQPELLLIPHAEDADQQHRVTHELCIESAWLASYPIWESDLSPIKRPKAILEYEVWTPLKLPNYFEDISSNMTTKLKALRCYQSQLRITRLDLGVEGLNAYRGNMFMNVPFAEAYSIREYRSDHLMMLPFD